ncbi:transposase [Streptomyces sp. DSM 44915]|uniref:Transposase n=1 Tax=Streptomyces chisholmiae TaxID=3075540 RepID=A0ABU2JZA4_9ACTN|nr:transposase [Streptomyces sp. DSM 44915]MDT0270299.1 transposase [Streptomyces sp. DSM 44915]
MLANDVVPMFTRDPIASYASEIFSAIPRVDQRRWAEVYLRGLLSVKGKKSVKRIAESILAMPAHQSLQQFINQSPWRWAPVRAMLARHVQSVAPPQAWVLGRVVIPKRGDRSVGVERQFLPEAGRMMNCQVGLSVSLVTATSSVPVNWRILLPKAWDGTLTRQTARIPDHVESRPEWLEGAAMVQEMADRWGLTRVPVVANVRHLRQTNELVTRLASGGLPFVLEVGDSLRVLGDTHPSPALRSRPTLARRSVGPSLETVLTARDYLHTLTGNRHQRNHSLAPVSSAVRRSFVRSSLVKIPGSNGSAAHPIRLLTEISPEGEAVRFWVTNLKEHRIDELMALARLESRSREDMHNLELNFGLRDFEGRSFRGWHHHMTMVSAAYIFARLGRDAHDDCPSCTSRVS